jgi:cytochrome c-type biogenesis protein CcmH/NrfG
MFRYGWAKFRDGAKQEGLSNMRTAVKHDQTNFSYLTKIAEVLMRDGEKEQLEEAKNLLDVVIKGDPNHADALVCYGRIIEKKNGDLNQAKSYYERAIAVQDANHVNAHFYLGVLCEK